MLSWCFTVFLSFSLCSDGGSHMRPDGSSGPSSVVTLAVAVVVTQNPNSSTPSPDPRPNPPQASPTSTDEKKPSKLQIRSSERSASLLDKGGTMEASDFTAISFGKLKRGQTTKGKRNCKVKALREAGGTDHRQL